MTRRAVAYADVRVALAAAVVAIAALFVGCGRGGGESGSQDGAASAMAADERAAGDDSTVETRPPPKPEMRSLRLAHVGWQFDLDAATTGEATRVEVLVRAATVGAAPQRLQVELDGTLIDAFATDLDRDAAPELLLWTRSAGSSAEGQVQGWRFTDAGDAIDIALPSLDDDSAIGWRGRDQFGVQGDVLVRGFPLYRDEDDNASPSAGFVRVIRYRLEPDGFIAFDGTLEPMEGTPQAEVLAR
jgi:hypothetical protein